MKKRIFTGPAVTLFVILAMAVMAAAAVPSYTLTGDDLERRIDDTARSGQTTYTSYYNIGQVSREDLRRGSTAARQKGGRVILYFDTLDENGEEVTARISVNPYLVKSSQGSLNFIVDVSEETNAEIRKTFATRLGKNVAVITCEQKESFGMPVVVSGKVDLTGMNTVGLIVYTYDAERNTYAPLENANCMADGNGYVHFQTRQGGTFIVTSAN